MREFEDTGEVSSATHAIEEGLGWTECAHGDDALIEKRLEGTGDMLNDRVGTAPTEG